MIKSIQIVGNAKYGGATYLMLEWCKYLIERGCKVDVLSTDNTMVSELHKIPGVHVIDSIYIPREIKPVDDLRAFAQIISLVYQKRYDVVHTYTATPSFLGRMAACFVGVPVIVAHQGGWAVNEYSSLLEKIVFTPLEYLAVLASTKTICVSHAEAILARQLGTAPQHKLVTIVNGVNPQAFIAATENGLGEAMRRKLGISADHLLIGSTGRLAPGKGNETLIQAMASLRKLIKGVPLTLLFAGDGVEQKKLENLVHTLGLEKQVRFLGFQRDIPAFLAGIDVFVTPTLSEGLSISLLEAMVTARPIVATSILPNMELIEHKVTGLLAPVQSPEGIAQAIATFVQKPELAQHCSRAARKRVLECYTLDRMFEETWNLYIGLLKHKRPESMLIKAVKIEKENLR